MCYFVWIANVAVRVYDKIARNINEKLMKAVKLLRPSIFQGSYCVSSELNNFDNYSFKC